MFFIKMALYLIAFVMAIIGLCIQRKADRLLKKSNNEEPGKNLPEYTLLAKKTRILSCITWVLVLIALVIDTINLFLSF